MGLEKDGGSSTDAGGELSTVARDQSGTYKASGRQDNDPKPGVPLCDGVEDLTTITSEALYGPNRTSRS